LAEYIAGTGDTLVILKNGGRCDVRELNADGVWQAFRGTDLIDLHTAWGVALNRLTETKGREIWYRLESEPDSTIQPYKVSRRFRDRD
jgi:hypothetical protein